MRSPYLITEPTVISFSGGRSSAYMLHRVLEDNAGLPDGSKVVFANTGKEMPQTLDFVQACSDQWSVHITWVEYPHGMIDPAQASRDGEPFAALITKKNHLPNRVMRFCTSELKVNLINAAAPDCRMHFVGIRGDEPRRATRIHNKVEKKRTTVCPMWEDKVTERDVLLFWNQQSFDLQLHPDQSNCDLCFLKGKRKAVSITRLNPALADWWIAQEARIGATFNNRLPYVELKALAANGQQDAFVDDPEFACFCGD